MGLHRPAGQLSLTGVLLTSVVGSPPPSLDMNVRLGAFSHSSQAWTWGDPEPVEVLASPGAQELRLTLAGSAPLPEVIDGVVAVQFVPVAPTGNESAWEVTSKWLPATIDLEA